MASPARIRNGDSESELEHVLTEEKLRSLLRVDFVYGVDVKTPNFIGLEGLKEVGPNHTDRNIR